MPDVLSKRFERIDFSLTNQVRKAEAVETRLGTNVVHDHASLDKTLQGKLFVKFVSPKPTTVIGTPNNPLHPFARTPANFHHHLLRERTERKP